MATFRRALTPGATYFFTVNTYQRQQVLTEKPFYTALKQSLRRIKEAYPFKIEALVLPPDHLHCIWTLPKDDADYALRWNLIKRLTSQQTRHPITPELSESRKKRGELGLWQRRFWEHQIKDERDFERHVDYIHWNPVKHGYVKAVAEWPYSSFHGFVERDIYPLNWAGDGITHVPDGDYGEPV